MIGQGSAAEGRRRDAFRRPAALLLAALATGLGATPAAASPAAPVEIGYCVRICDGYAFPTGDIRRARDIGLHEDACRAACPGAQTDLHVGSRARGLAGAVSLARGTPYTALPTAFLNRTRRVDGCSCNAPGSVVRAGAADRTLRPGDVLVTPDGARVLGRDGVLAEYDTPGAAPESLRRMIAVTLGPNHAATWRAYAASRPAAVAQAPQPRIASDREPLVTGTADAGASPARAGFVMVSGAVPVPQRPAVSVAAAPARGGFVQLN